MEPVDEGEEFPELFWGGHLVGDCVKTRQNNPKNSRKSKFSFQFWQKFLQNKIGQILYKKALFSPFP